jgi:hypothetical protein
VKIVSRGRWLEFYTRVNEAQPSGFPRTCI